MGFEPCSARVAAMLLVLGMGLIVPAAAQSPATPASALKRTEVTRADVAQPGHEAVVMKVELAPGGHAGRHTHPGNEISYVVDGDCSLLIDGQPARKLHAGDAFVVKTGQVHDLRNDGGTPVHLIGVYEVEKGKPLATPRNKGAR